MPTLGYTVIHSSGIYDHMQLWYPEKNLNLNSVDYSDSLTN